MRIKRIRFLFYSQRRRYAGCSGMWFLQTRTEYQYCDRISGTETQMKTRFSSGLMYHVDTKVRAEYKESSDIASVATSCKSIWLQASAPATPLET